MHGGGFFSGGVSSCGIGGGAEGFALINVAEELVVGLEVESLSVVSNELYWK